MSSRIAVCGQQPVCTPTMRSAGEHALPLEDGGVLLGEDVVGHHHDATLARSNARHRHATSSVLPVPTGPPMPTRSGAPRRDRRGAGGVVVSWSWSWWRAHGGCSRQDGEQSGGEQVRACSTAAISTTGPVRAGRSAIGPGGGARTRLGDDASPSAASRAVSAATREGVEAEQAHGGLGRRGDRVVHGEPGRRRAAPSPAATPTAPRATGWCGAVGQPSTERQHRGGPAARRRPARAGARAGATRPAAARPGCGRRPRRRARRAAVGHVVGPPADATVAAASAASMSPAVCSRPTHDRPRASPTSTIAPVGDRRLDAGGVDVAAGREAAVGEQRGSGERRSGHQKRK